ncbi:hypothetical protein FRACYDRAFT_243747 [Fragilariopsis cylindrus CCMP1102]|uniref:Uncharacterized protein n=1 Tax=Fragilariopsis cylindrus CCMP1102 TaxID=635003 RepID=A0A1E7F2X9_9STRA|nr:hypothetical protein FRACYDRAFT_243747 [Fragilariopsis cylindrus CCMP1102]|eukprot:OEU12497.1 hypothetical protein FRACYDRAFT_243747 [Fragilariopsis cylindrus CCMP1102]
MYMPFAGWNSYGKTAPIMCNNKGIYSEFHGTIINDWLGHDFVDAAFVIACGAFVIACSTTNLNTKHSSTCSTLFFLSIYEDLDDEGEDGEGGSNQTYETNVLFVLLVLLGRQSLRYK